MSIRFACEKCRRVYELPDESAGRQAKCECGEMLLVPAQSTYTGRMRTHEEGPSSEQPPQEEPKEQPSREPPPLPEEPFRFESAPAQSPEPPAPLEPPAPPSPPEPPRPEPAAFDPAPPAALPPPVAPVGAPLKTKYRNLRAYCVYMRYFAILVAIGGTLWFLVQGYLLAVMLQQTPNVVIAVTSLGSMLMTVFLTLAWYVVLNAMSEFFQVLIDIEENTRRNA